MNDRPKSLKDKSEQIARKKLLGQEHIYPLTEFVDTIRRKEKLGDDIPYFDPLDGGVKAQCLFVLEAPGQKAKDSGFVSRNNNDESAKNFFLFNEEAGISRQKTITWNIVPWYVDKKKRNIRQADIRAGLLYLLQLLDLLPNIGIIVLVGGNARRIKSELKNRYSDIDIFHSFHPSPLHVNRNKPANAKVIINQLKQVRRALDRLTQKK